MGEVKLYQSSQATIGGTKNCQLNWGKVAPPSSPFG